MAIKELTKGKDANQLARQSPFGRPPYGGGYESSKDYKTGELVMLSEGLYRIKQAETISTIFHIGIQGTLTASATGSITIDMTQNNRRATELNTVAKVFPAGIQVLLGEQGFNNTNQIITNRANATSSTAGLLTITTDDTVRTALYPVGTECTILFIPKNETHAKQFLLDKTTMSALESPSSDTVIYELLWGLSQHPKYIGEDGEITSSGLNNATEATISSTNFGAQMGGTPIGSGGVRSGGEEAGNTSKVITGSGHGASGYGTSMVKYAGMISPSVRVYQPESVVRFSSDREKNTDATISIAGGQLNKSGFLDASDTSALSPNPSYRLLTGSNGNDGTLPFFETLQATEEDLHDPHIVIIGNKFTLVEVSTEEVKQMVRRSGRFNYKIIQDPTQAYKDLSDGVTGPRNGWKEAVEATKGRRMSFDDYKKLTDNVTSQTMNLLYGTSTQQVAKRSGIDPRQRHRGN